MNETKFTPGPWEVGESEVTIPSPVGELFMGVGNLELGRSVARISRLSTFDDEDEANACLIAAAPDLLAACEAMLKMLHKTNASKRVEANMARAAIKKATRRAI